MTPRRIRIPALAVSTVLAAGLLSQALAQAPAPPAPAPANPAFNPNMTGAPGGGVGGRGAQGPRCSGGVEQLPDNRVTFRLCAPNAQSVAVTGDIFVPASAFTKGEAGLWTGTTPQPVGADTYRYYYTVDGLNVVDPSAREFSDTLSGIRGIVEVKGPEGEYQTFNKDIPHGQVHQVYYWSTAFNAQRRMQVYTPPGYEANDSKRYPVLYIRHGAGDNDSSWMTAGRANYILDNLIAAKKAVPMIIVSTADSGGPEQPTGIVAQPSAPQGGNAAGASRGAAGPGTGSGAAQAALPTGVGTPTPSGTYGRDLFEVVIPYIDKHYRTVANARNRAMAGLSAGGAATLNNGLPNPQMFQWIGIYSIGTNPETYLARNKAALEKGKVSNQLLYYAIGKEDRITNTGSGAATSKMLGDLGYRNYVFNESDGGHTWINWRRYLNDFAPRLFK